MKIVLLSGCSGWRLWPLSHETRSKQFLKLLTSPDGKRESMIQRIHRQLLESNVTTKEEIYVVTSESQMDFVKKQLGAEIKVILEPERRNTLAAISLLCSFFASRENADLQEPIAVVPVDTFSDERFFKSLGDAERIVKEKASDFVLFGANPTYPSEKYGYLSTRGNLVIPGERMAALNGTGFIEKPSQEQAESLIAEGAFWNMGSFVSSIEGLKGIVSEYTSHESLENYETMLSEFGALPKMSFDKAVLEKKRNFAVIPYLGEWKDLGTWNTLTEAMKESTIGLVKQGEECENTHVINELGIPIMVLGGKNLVVAASPDGILVSDKHKSSYIKPYVQEMENRPMYEERKWGEYKVLDYNQYEDGNKSLSKHLTIQAGKSISYQKHFNRDEIWTIVDGTGELLIDNEVTKVARGDVAYIKKGQKHALRADKEKDLQFIEVQIGPELAEEDIERFPWEWKD